MTRSSVALVLLALLSAASARAEDSATLDKMVELNRKALDELRLGQKEAARDDLVHAMTIGKRAGLASHQMMARTYLHLGAVYLTGYGDRGKAFKELVSAVKIKASIQITPQLLTPSLQETFEQARAHVLGGTATPEASKQAPPPAIAQAPASEAAAKAPSEGKAVKPAMATPASSAPPSAVVTTAEKTGVPTAGATTEIQAEAPPRETPTRFWVALGIGSGVGWHNRRDLEMQTDYSASSGISPAAFVHLVPEIGYRYDARTAFSLQARDQIIPTVGPESELRTAHAVFVRAQRLLLPFSEHAELWGTAAVGAGSAIRFFVPARPSAGLMSNDTVEAGPVAFGPGVSVVYRTSEHVALVSEVRAMITVWHVAALADLNVGAAYAF